MMSPNLIIPGFAKSGTSSLFYYLSKHPQICPSKSKEPHVYSIRERYQERFEKNSNYSYNRLFSDCSKNKYRMEASTSYAQLQGVPDLISNDNKDCKLIFILRDPIDRIVSHYRWLVSLGYAKKPFRQEVEEWYGMRFSTSKKYSFNGNYKFYTDISMYYKHLTRWFEMFGMHNIHMLAYEQLVEQPRTALKAIQEFLNLNYCDLYDGKVINRTRKSYKKREGLMSDIKGFVPSKLKAGLRKKLQFLLKKEEVFPSLSPQDKRWIYMLLKDDICGMKNLNFDISYWRTINEQRE